MISRDDADRAMKCGGPAFPTESDRNYFHGMSLRDWFAGIVLGHIIDKTTIKDMERFTPDEVRKGTAHGAYLLADAMLVERDKS